MVFELPKLEYGFDALEPYIDSKTMEIHHDKHHAGYVNKLNKALEGSEFEGKEIEELLKDIESVPSEIRQAVINNGGGHANQSLFWKTMGPNCGGEPSGVLLDEINKMFGSFSEFKKKFESEAVKRFGSGWCWLVVSSEGLKIISTANQDSPLMSGLNPVLGLDVWEHAYYLKYQNKRNDYISAWWNIVDWNKVAKLWEEYN